MKSRSATPYLLIAPALLWLAVFFVVPLTTMASQSLQTGNYEDGYVLTWHIATYYDSIREFYPHILRSLLYAFAATVAALVIAYPLAYTIAFRAGRFKNVMLLLVIAPFFTSFLLRTLAWQSILQDNGWVVRTLDALAVPLPDGRLLNTAPAVICGLTYNFLPFMTLPLFTSLDKIDPRLVEAAGDLYSNPVTAFRKVTFPLSLPGVVAGTLLTFIPAAGDYVNVTFLGQPSNSMLGNVIQNRFLGSVDYPTAAALSMTLLVAILAMVVVYVRRSGTEELT